jgi:hypothetical protein
VNNFELGNEDPEDRFAKLGILEFTLESQYQYSMSLLKTWNNMPTRKRF